MENINKFSGKYSFLSNFYETRINFEENFYPSVEHAFQAAKCTILKERKIFQSKITPGKAKRLGKKVKLRDGWDDIKLSTMEQLIRYKFNYNLLLKEKLIDTYPQTLIEGNYWNDVYWGVCNTKGENHLGVILMKIRKELISRLLRNLDF